MSLLGPQWLVSHVNTIALLLGVVTLFLFGSFVNNKIIFPFADWVRAGSSKRIQGEKSRKYISEGLATIVFLLYCYLGSSLVAEYFIAPILLRMKDFLLIVVIGLFFLISHYINDRRFRKRFFGRD